MASIRIQNVTKQFGGHVVLRDFSLELHPGEIAGIVGPNGAGKTTLFKLIQGAIPPDMGTVTRAKGLRVGYLAQEPEIGLENTLHDEVLSAFEDVLNLERKLHSISADMAEAHHDPARLEALMQQYDKLNAQFEAAGGYAFETSLNEILGGLGFNERDRELPLGALSGGQKCRAALAKLLLQDSSYLLLDEPTNHLDIDAVRWLEKFLAGHHGGAAIISHDRYLLDRVADRIIEVRNQTVTNYPGNYTNYAKVRQLRRLTQERQAEKDRAFVEKEQAFIKKHMAGQRTREAQGRRKRLERRMDAGEFTLADPQREKGIKLSFRDTLVHEGRVALEAEELAKAYDDKPLFRDLNLEVAVGERIGITGPNGTGKSTLLKILIGQVDTDTGEVRIDSKTTLGYYAQEAGEFPADATPYTQLLEVAPELSETRARSILAQFLFSGDDVFKPMNSLSGGEQSRLRLCKLILEAPNMLLLDEPTNHLDIQAREALEAALAQYPGTIIAVSHDRYFLDRIAQKLLVMRAGESQLHLGNYTQYIEAVEARDRSTAANDGKTKTQLKREKRERSKSSTKQAEPSAPPSRFAKMKLDKLEEFIMDTEVKLGEFEQQFADPEVLKDGDRVAELRDEFERLQAELAEAERAWEAKASE